MHFEKLLAVRGLFTEPGAAQNDDVLDLIDALLDDAPSEPPADVRSPGSLDARDGFGMSARSAGRIVYVVLCGPGEIALDAFDNFDDAQRFAGKAARRVVVRARLEEEP